MNAKDNRPQLERPTTAGQPAPKKRFLIGKLEERIAPRKGGKGTRNCFSTSY